MDDGRSPLAVAAGPFDDEGLPRQLNRLFDRDRLAGVLYSSATAPFGAPDESVAGDGILVRQLAGEGG